MDGLIQDYHKKIPERLKMLMELHGIDQSKLAKEIGTSTSAISQILSGKRSCGLALIVRLSKHFSVSVDYLLGIGFDKTKDVRARSILWRIKSMIDDENLR